jgi:sarcosine oxidase subunit gamma
MLPARHARDRFAVIWSGRGHWLAIGPLADGIAARLASCAGELGSVTDLTGACTIVRVAGARARDGLMKLVPVDLDASVFTPGSAAATVVAHIPVQLWPVQLCQTDQSPTYEISCPRSYAASLWRTLSAAFAEYGYDVSAAR